MGFFDLKVKCAICNNDIGLNRYQLQKDIWICSKCLDELGGTKVYIKLKEMSIEEIKNTIDTYKIKAENFNATRKFANYLYIDEGNKQWAIPNTSVLGKVKNLRIYNFHDIMDFELIEDGNTVIKGGTGRAIVGGAVLGGVGAIVGGTTGKRTSKSTCSKLQIKITLDSINNPVEYINLLETEFKKDGLVYKQNYELAQRILSTLQIICNSNQNIQNVNTNSVADELKKFKELLDVGAITTEEYETKKQQLLK